MQPERSREREDNLYDGNGSKFEAWKRRKRTNDEMCENHFESVANVAESIFVLASSAIQQQGNLGKNHNV